jgi:signal transduction histidine kinase
MRRRLQSWLAGEAEPSPLAGVAVAVAGVAASTLIIYPLESEATPLSLDVLYIPGILLVAAGWGALFGIVMTLASVVAFDFFHVPPTHEFTLGSDLDPLLAFAVAALAAAVVATLTARVRVAEERGRARGQAQARLIAATDDERRRVVRDLHDGAQQRLVHAVIKLKLARRALEEGSDDALGLVREGLEQAEEATSELRELAHGILPAVLTRGGLQAGVQSLARRMSLPITVEVCAERFPPAIEATAYFVVSEALTNTEKHSDADRAEVRARVEDGSLRVDVRDDGTGGARLDQGSGLVGLADRVDALDGQLLLRSPPGGGTLVRAVLPLPE